MAGGGAQTLDAGEAEADQSNGQAALGQIPGRNDAVGELVVGVSANVKPGIVLLQKVKIDFRLKF